MKNFKIKNKAIRFLILIGVFLVMLLLLQFALPQVGTIWLAIGAAAVGFLVADMKVTQVQSDKGGYLGD